ncbi:MAG TPA: hypothetical protein VGR52_07960 [Stellaceae bacterium]|nr:hypothetical protein [Stellaceae bacterium]
MRLRVYSEKGRPLIPDYLFWIQFAISLGYALWAVGHAQQFQEFFADQRFAWLRELPNFVPCAQKYGAVFGAVTRDVLSQIWAFNLIVGSIGFISLRPLIHFYQRTNADKTRKFAYRITLFGLGGATFMYAGFFAPYSPQLGVGLFSYAIAAPGLMLCALNIVAMFMSRRSAS